MPSDQTEAQPWYNPTATEEALRESEERYYAMFQHMNSGVAVFRAVDGGGDFVFKDLNEAAERISRIRRKEVIGKRLLATFPDVEKYGLPGIIGRVFRTGTPEQLPAARYRDQTREAWREGFAYRLPSGDVVMIYDDVTDRVNAEIALRESEKKYRQLVELAQEGIWVGDREWNTTFVNPRFAEMLGYALSDMPGRNIADYMDPGDLPDHGIRMARRTQGKNETYERKFRHRDGSYRWFLVSATALHDDAGNFSGSYAVFTDITDRKLAGEALRESEERQRLLIEYSGLGIAYWDYSGRLMFLNRKGIENMGGCVEDFTGKHVTELFPGDRAKEFAERISSMKDAFGSRVYEDLVPLPGGPRWFLSTFTNVLDTGGNPSGVQIISQDITDRKEAEEKLEISEILYRTIFETSGSATAILDRDGNILIANAETAPLFGYAPQELEGKVHWSALVLPDELPRLAEFWRLLHADPGSGQRYEARLLDRRGTVKHGLLCVRMIPSTQNCVVSVTDITERKNAEEALAQSEERYRAVLESQTEFITRFTPDSTVTFANDAYLRYFGLDREAITGKKFRPEVPPEDRETLGRHLAGLTREAPVGTIEHRIIMPGGQVRWQKWVDRAIFDAAGHLIEYQSVGRDTTDRVLTEEALRESEEKYRNLVERASDGIAILQDRKLRFVNRRYALLWGGTVEEMVGRDLTDFIHPDERDKVVHRYFQRLMGDKTPPVYETVLLHRDGSTFAAELNSGIISYQGKPATLVFIHDITERKKAEKALRESEEMFRNPVEKSPVGVFLFQGGAVRYSNPKLAEMFGYTREEVTTTPLAKVIHPDDLEESMKQIARWQPGVTGAGYFTFRGVKKDGKVIDLEAHSSNMTYQGLPAIYGTIIDISERKQLENRIRESLQEKEVLLKEIHHRVKNNMQVISSLLSMQAQNVKDPEVRSLFNESQNRIRSIALVHELLYRSDNLDQIEYGAYLKKMFLPLFESYNIDQRKVSMAIDAKDVMISIEKAVPCSLIVNELISNSLKHAFPGDRKGEIRIGFRLDGESGKYLLEYRDNGAGVPPGFDVAASTTLGMRLIHGLTRQLQGTVGLQPGEGVHFVIQFPAKKQQGGG